MTNRAMLMATGGTAGVVGIGLPTTVKVTNYNPNMRNKYFNNEVFSVDLSWDSKTFWEDFNKPGDCITKLFPGIDKSKEGETGNRVNVFKRPASLDAYPFPTQQVTSYDVFDATEFESSPDVACLVLKKKEQGTGEKKKVEKFRLEIALRKANEGWIWMAGQRDKEGDKKLHFREIAIKQDKDTWKVEGANEGTWEVKIEDSIPLFYKETFPVKVRGENNEICLMSRPCTNLIRAAIWIPDEDSSEPFLTISDNLDKSVLAFSNVDRIREERNIKGTRENIYRDGAWYKDNSADRTKLEIINFDKHTIIGPNAQGTWSDLITYCQTGSIYRRHIYRTFCF